MNTPARTRDRLLYLLKTRGPLSTPTLARKLEITSMGVRQHLQALADEGLLQRQSQVQGVGRPRQVWSLTASGHERFPEGYGDLAVDLIEAARQQFGQRGVDALLAARLDKQKQAYARALPARRAGLGDRVRALARLRSADGYMAEVRKQADGSFTLIENHCPICAAATLCIGLCHSELQLFRELLGDNVTIERREHMLAESRRCTYRIAARKRGVAPAHKSGAGD